MSITDLGNLLAFLRITDLETGDPLADVAQQALDAAEVHAGQFIGSDLSELADSFGTLPAPVSSAVAILAAIEFDANDPAREHTLRARAESLLRPYRIETGFAGSTCAE